MRLASGPQDTRHLRLAKLRRGLRQSVKNALQIERRAADHLEHVGGRGLLLSRLGEFARERIELVFHLARVRLEFILQLRDSLTYSTYTGYCLHLGRPKHTDASTAISS